MRSPPILRQQTHEAVAGSVPAEERVDSCALLRPNQSDVELGVSFPASRRGVRRADSEFGVPALIHRQRFGVQAGACMPRAFSQLLSDRHGRVGRWNFPFFLNGRVSVRLLLRETEMLYDVGKDEDLLETFQQRHLESI